MLKNFLVTALILSCTIAFYDISNAADNQTIQYKQEDIRNTSTRTRKRAQVGIYLADPKEQFIPDQLAATCAAAAKYYAEKYDLKLVSIFLSDAPVGNGWEGTRLAQCSYSPDNGGASGSQGWTWDHIQVADKPLTDQQREMRTLWAKMRNKFQKNGSTDEDALSEAIAKKMKIKPEEVTLPVFLLDDMDVTKFENVNPQGPVN